MTAWLNLIAVPGLIFVSASAHARPVTHQDAQRAAIHPTGDTRTMQAWLERVPITRDFPDDFGSTLTSHGAAFIVEMTTAPGCIPCGDLWAKLSAFGTRYGWRVRTISKSDALLRSGRLGLPWVGHPVAWVRPVNDEGRLVPVAIGTDHSANLGRNLYLAAKMLTGVRPAVGVRAMAKFTGIVGLAPPPAARSR